MPGIIVYPGIAPGSTEYFYNDMRVQQVMTLDKDDVHSVYKCTEMSDQKGTVECPFLLIIKNVNDEGRGEYMNIGSHNHMGERHRKCREAFHRSIMYEVVQRAEPGEDLREFLKHMNHLFGSRTREEMDQIYESLNIQRRAAALRRQAVAHWNCIPFGVPRQALPKVHINSFGSEAHDPGVVQRGPSEQPRCRLCTINPACVVVLGCGHLSFCYGCACFMRKGYMQCCPVCNGRFLDSDGHLQMQLINFAIIN